MRYSIAVKFIAIFLTAVALVAVFSCTLGIVQVDEAVWKRLSKEDKAEIEKTCDEKLTQYFSRIK